MSTFRTSLEPLSTQIKNAQIEDTFVTDVFAGDDCDPKIQLYFRVTPKYLTQNDRSEFRFTLQFVENHGYKKLEVKYELWLERDDGRKTKARRFVTEFDDFGLNLDGYRGLTTKTFEQFAADHEVFIVCEILPDTARGDVDETEHMGLVKKTLNVVLNSNLLQWTVPAAKSMRLKSYELTNNEMSSATFHPFESEQIDCQLFLLNSDSEGTKWKTLIMHLTSELDECRTFKVSIWLSTNSGNRSSIVEKYCLIDKKSSVRKRPQLASKSCGGRRISQIEPRKDVWEWKDLISMDKLKELVKGDRTFTVNCQVELARTSDNNQLSNLQLDQSSARNVSESSTNVQTSTSNSHSSEPAPKRRREEVDTNRMPMISSETDAPSSTNEKSWSFYLNHQFTDYKIFTSANDNKRVFDVHRNILASKAGYFERLFLENNDQTSTVIEEDPSIVALMIEFMYRDKLDNMAAYITKLFKAAIRFEIPTLKAKAFKHLEQNLTTDNAGAYVLLAMETSDDQVINLMRSFIRRSSDNHSKICNSTEFHSLLETNAEEFLKAHRFLHDLLNDIRTL
ncbi:hypothetical protein M3Y94_01079000 [Aphelenchoides besseyi]|nr:hypothetical protein M3Y94_01079000 [Aphelenchoides besseyi]KAI6218774.1 Speckle-type POZ protein A-like protein [Aphelenchoides besseyi]